MKAQMKAVMASAVVIVLALAAVSGVTYSWFSDSENTDISITTGVIELDVEYSEFKLESYNKSSTTVSLGSQGTFPNGVGTFNSTSDKAIPYKTITEITMEKMVPGDKVSFSMETISLKTDLDVHVGLDVIVYKGSTESIDNPFKITYGDLSVDYPKGDYDNLGPLNFIIELPTETGPEYMGSEYSIAIVLEAIQSAAVPSKPSTFNFVENNGVLTANVESEVYGQKVTIVFTADDNSELNSSENYSLVVAPSDGSVLDDFGPNTKSISFELTDSNGGEISEGFTATVKLPVEDDVQNIVHISDSTKSIVPGVIFSENENIRYAEFTIDSFSDFVLFNGEVSGQEMLSVVLGAVDKSLTLKVGDGNYVMPISNNINFQEKELSVMGSKNVVFDMSVVDARNQFVTGATMTFDGITLNYGNVNYMGLANTSSLTYKDCNINGLQFLYGNKVAFNNCNLNSNGAEHCVWTYGVKDVIFTECSFEYADRGINCYCDNDVSGGKQTVRFQDCSFITSNTESEGAVEINSINFSKGIDVFMNDCNAPAYGEMVYISPWDSNNGAKTAIVIDGKVNQAPGIINSERIANGGIFKVESDLTMSGTIAGDLYLDLGDNGFEGTNTITLSNNADLTMYDGDYVVKSTYGHVDVRPSSTEGSTLLFENVDFSYEKLGKTYGPSTNRLGSVVEVCATVSDAKTVVVFRNCTFNNAQVLFEGLSGTVGVFEATFDGCTFNALTSSSPIEVTNYVKGTLNVINCTFNLECTSSTASAISVSPSSSTSIVINANNNTMNATAATPYTYDESKGETEVDNVKVNGTPANIKFISSYDNCTVNESNTTVTGIASEATKI